MILHVKAEKWKQSFRKNQLFEILKSPWQGKISLCQPTYTREILRRFGMENSKSIATPVDQGSRLMKATENDQTVNQELYQSAVGSLLYLSTKTRPDIAFAVGNVARFCSQPNNEHWKAVKRILCYL